MFLVSTYSLFLVRARGICGPNRGSIKLHASKVFCAFYSTLLEFLRKYKNPSAIILCKKLKNFCLNGIEIIS